MTPPHPRSSDTRRRIVFIVVALIVVTLVLASTGCSTTAGTGQAGEDRDGPAPLDASLYPAAMTDICSATDEELAELPSPGDGIAEADWAAEVSRVLEGEAEALGEIGAVGEVRTDHRTFVTNTRDQAAQWSLLSTAIGDADPEGIDAARTEILELSRGRIELAAELGVSGCRERNFS